MYAADGEEEIFYYFEEDPTIFFTSVQVSEAGDPMGRWISVVSYLMPIWNSPFFCTKFWEQKSLNMLTTV